MTERLTRILDCLDAAMNGQTVNVAASKEFWLKLNDGTSMPVASVESAGVDMPFYCFTVHGYDGKTCQLEDDANEDSVDELCNLIIDILF